MFGGQEYPAEYYDTAEYAEYYEEWAAWAAYAEWEHNSKGWWWECASRLDVAPEVEIGRSTLLVKDASQPE
jgi:hypothetical protein